jgi:phenylacetate-CoA ligase
MSRVSYIQDGVEALSRQEIKTLQANRLRVGIGRFSKTVPFYREKLRQMGVSIDDIRSIEDLSRLPFTLKSDLRDHYPFGLLAVPLREVSRVHASSGTTGKPTVVAYTRNDVELWSELMARSLAVAGVTDEDIVHNAYGYGLFTGGLGFHYGAERLGATVIPVSGGNTKRQLMILGDFGARSCVARLPTPCSLRRSPMRMAWAQPPFL